MSPETRELLNRAGLAATNARLAREDGTELVKQARRYRAEFNEVVQRRRSEPNGLRGVGRSRALIPDENPFKFGVARRGNGQAS